MDGSQLLTVIAPESGWRLKYHVSLYGAETF